METTKLPTQELREEHEGIKVALAALGKICDALEAGREVNVAHLKGILEFLQVFADTCHHGKEEGFLFPALEEAGIPKEHGPIAVMLAEHDEGRAYIRGMKEAIGNYAAGDRTAAGALVKNARGYSDLLTRHIEKENDVLFVMAEKALPPEKQRRIDEEFQKLERERIGPGRHEKFHEFLEELEKEYL